MCLNLQIIVIVRRTHPSDVNLSTVWSISTCLLHQYHYVHELKTWTEAQSYCRRHYTDLATIENSFKMDQLINAVSGESVQSWIGLFRNPNFKWSDGSSFSFTYWYDDYNPLGSSKIICVWSISTCLLHQYHYVHELKTWTEAQSYCRRHYTDLATIENSFEMDQLINAVSDKSVSEVWIGLFSEVDWRWSDGYTGNESRYRHWDPDWSEPDFKGATELCVLYRSYGWWDIRCDGHFPFICSSEFVYINQSLNWTAAQSYCRSNYVDLATVKNPSDEQKIQNVTPSGQLAWIGLFRNPNFNWSDGSSFSFTYWYGGSNLLGTSKIICGVTSLEHHHSGEWRFFPCDHRRPFVCHSIRE
uniref:C-type lectin domain-containing protein n=1 Tax=Sphaeramia orbicularis TaxID=375764 RepID=A0A673BAT7_9TELE